MLRRYFMLFVLSFVLVAKTLTGDCTLAEILDFAAQSRQKTDAAHSSEKKGEEMQNFILNSLDDYSINHSLEASIESFLRKKLGLSNFYIKDVRSLPDYKAGKTVDALFIVFDTEENPLLVVKAFPKTYDRKNLRFLRELSAFHFFQSHPLKNAALEKPLAAGKCTGEGTEWALLAKSFCPGKTVDKFFQSGEENEKLMKLLGQAIGELHSLRQRKGAPEISLVPKLYAQLSDAIAKGGQEIAVLDLARVEMFVDEVICQYLEAPFYYTYHHGDPNFGNILYDKEAEVLSFIDLSGFHKSISIEGEAMGYGAKEIAKIEFYLENLPEIPTEAIEDLKRRFREGYCAYMPNFPPEEHKRFYKVCSLLKILTKKIELDEELAVIQIQMLLILINNTFN